MDEEGLGTNRRPGIASSPRGALGSGPRGLNPKDPPHPRLGRGWPSGQPTPHIYVPVRVPSEIPEFRETIKTPKICSYWKDIGSRLCGYTRAGNFGDGSGRPAVHSKRTAERRLHRSEGGGAFQGWTRARTTTGEWSRATTKLKKTVSDLDVLYARLVPHVVRPLPSYHIQTNLG